MVSPMRTRFDRHSSRVRLAALGAVLAALSITALATTTAKDAFGYKATDVTAFSFIDVSEGGATVLTGVDDGKVALTLPFPFTFYGHAYPMVCVSANGAAYFIDVETECAAIPNDFANTDLTAAAPPGDRAGLFPLWSDLAFAGAGTGLAYQVQGATPNRKFVMQWNNAYPLSKDDGVSPVPVTFQVVLLEENNQILFQYNRVYLGVDNKATNGGLATVGIRNAGALVEKLAGNVSNPTFGHQIPWSYNSAVLSNGKAILFTFGKATPVINVTGGTSPYTGTPHTGTGTAYGTGGLSDVLPEVVTLSYAGVAPTAYGPSPDGPIDVGTYEVTGAFTGNPDYTSGSGTASLVITSAGQTITFTSTAPSAAVFGGPTYDVTATGGASGNAVTFSSLTTGVCTVGANGVTVSFVGVGTCEVAANQDGNGNYADASQATQSFNVGKASQVITFTSTAPASPTVGGPTYDLSATGGDSGNPVVFSSLTGGTCTVGVNGFTVSFVGAGSCQVAANQAGNTTYAAAQQKTQSMTVTGVGTPTTTTINSNHNPGDFTQELNITATVRRTSNNTAVTGGTVTVKEGGTTLAGPIAVAADGKASFKISTLSVGNHTITAYYSGNASFAPSSVGVVQVVTKESTKTELKSSNDSSKKNENVTFTATVRDGKDRVIQGTVTFKEGATVLAGPITLDANGKATFSISTLSKGDHTITAVYNGTASYETSSASVKQKVK